MTERAKASDCEESKRGSVAEQLAGPSSSTALEQSASREGGEIIGECVCWFCFFRPRVKFTGLTREDRGKVCGGNE